MLKSIPFFASLLGKDLGGEVVSSTPHVLLYGAIETHSMGSKGCIAGNELLATETGIAKNQIRRYLADLKKANWISFEMSKDNKRGIIEPKLDIKIPLVARQPSHGRETTKPMVARQPTSIDNNIDNSLENTSGGDSPPQEVKEEKVDDVVITPCTFIDKVTGNMCGKNCMEKSVRCSHHAVQEIIDLFKPVNESYLEFYGKKTQHAAVKSLIKTYPKQELEWMIKTAPAYNKMPMRAAKEKIYTPYDLLKNWSVMKDNLISYKLQKQQGTKEVV